MWDGRVERRQRLTPFAGPERRWRSAPEDLGPQIWAILKDHRVPLRSPQPSPRMAHWEPVEEMDRWE